MSASARRRDAVRRSAPRALALAVIATALVVNLPHGLSRAESSALSARFSFARVAFPDPAGLRPATIRAVNPSLHRIRAWISAVGAGVALDDLDGNGRDDDACLVDPRFDTATVQPVPGTGARYRPLRLSPRPLRYDPATMAPMGCLPVDANLDGRLDLLVYYWGRTPVLFLRHGRGYVARELVAGHEIWNTNAVTSADVDGDGHADLVVGNYFADGARVLDARARTPVSMQHSMSRALNGGRNRILLWTAPGRYREARGALSPALADGWTLAVGAQDLNGDLLPELYFANDFGNDRLLLNRSRPGHVVLTALAGRKSFTDASSHVLGHDSFKGMGIDFGDLNGDGRPDMFVSNIAESYALMESNFAWLSDGGHAPLGRGPVPYHDAAGDLGLARSGWGWDTRLDDFDNDGTLEALQATGFLRGDVNRWPELQELAIGNDDLLSHASSWPRFGPGADLSGEDRDAFYARGPDGRFHDLGAQVGFAPGRVTRGIATADVNGDGRLDFAIADQWQRSFVFVNRCAAACGASVGLRLLLATGTPAVGAEVTVLRRDGRRLVRQVDGGNGHSGKRASDLLFGLGADRRPVRVTVRWRDLRGRVHATRTALGAGWHTIHLGGPR